MKKYKVIQDCVWGLKGKKPFRYRTGRIVEFEDNVDVPKRFFEETDADTSVKEPIQNDQQALSSALKRPTLNTGMAYKAPEDTQGIINSPAELSLPKAKKSK